MDAIARPCGAWLVDGSRSEERWVSQASLGVPPRLRGVGGPDASTRRMPPRLGENHDVMGWINASGLPEIFYFHW